MTIDIPRHNIAVVAGARPNFMKIAPIMRAFEARKEVAITLIHTGQHYDNRLSDVFFEELGIRKPDVQLECGGLSHGEQTARILEQIEKILITGPASGQEFDGIVVVGDVNSTMAATLAAAKLGVPVAHVEAGLRSFDRSMPEEINRMVTDSIADVLLVSEPVGVENLLREGHSPETVHLVGNVMIDTLYTNLTRAQARPILSELGLQPKTYATVTLHRPSNVDERSVLNGLINELIAISPEIPIVFPVHPRTQKRLEDFGLMQEFASQPNIRLMEPLGYFDFLQLNANAKVVITDSGGLQEETTALGVPCITMRANTERPITITEGTSTLVGNDASQLRQQLELVKSGKYKKPMCPELWDGKAAIRIVDILMNAFCSDTALTRASPLPQ